MRGLIENLSPENRRISWKVIGGVFAFYVAIMAVAAGMLLVHQSTRSGVNRPMAIGDGTASIAAVRSPLMSVALVGRVISR